MSYYNYMVVALESPSTKMRWDFKVFNVKVDAIYGEEYNQRLSDRWINFLDDVEQDYGILQEITPYGDLEQIVFTIADVENEDYPKVIKEFTRFWKSMKYEISDISVIEKT